MFSIYGRIKLFILQLQPGSASLSLNLPILNSVPILGSDLRLFFVLFYRDLTQRATLSPLSPNHWRGDYALFLCYAHKTTKYQQNRPTVLTWHVLCRRIRVVFCIHCLGCLGTPEGSLLPYFLSLPPWISLAV